MKIVTPFRAFPPESTHHQNLGAFDWLGAIAMLRASAARACRCETFVITDVDAAVPGPAHAFVTTHRRLMLWILEVSLAYLRSDAFDADTVMVSPDVMVFGDLRPMFRADLGLVVRTSPKFSAKPEKTVLNSVQWWRLDAKSRLVAFYERALAMAVTLPENRITWGADTDPLVELVWPTRSGLQERSGLSVFGHESTTVMAPFSGRDRVAIDGGHQPAPPVLPLVDFKYWRKTYQQRYFDALIGSAVAA